MMKRILRLAMGGVFGILIFTGCRSQGIPLAVASPVGVQASPTTSSAASPSPVLLSATPAPEHTQTMETVYPPPESTQPAYPGPPTQAEATSAYPDPASATQEAFPPPTQPVQSAYPAPEETSPTAYPGPLEPSPAYPGPTQSSNPIATALPTTAEPTGAPVTTTPTSPPVPTNTPLPSSTPTPQPSPTPALPPPIRSEIIATDPTQVKLVSGRVQLVEFYATWCVACRSMADGIHSLEALFGSQMNFIYLDIDDPANSSYKQALGYRFEPDLFLLDEYGKVLNEWSGWIDPQDLRAPIEAALK